MKTNKDFAPPGGGSVIARVIDTIRTINVSKRQDEYHVRAVYFDADSGQVDSVVVNEPVEPNGEIEKCYLEMDMQLIGYAVYGGSPEPMFICGDQYPYRVAQAMAFALRYFIATSQTDLQSR